MHSERLSAAPYIAVISQVQEVVLLGSADLAFWQRELARAGLAPAPRDGRAQLMLSAPVLRWAGIRFRELSLTVAVGAPPAGEPAIGYYLAQAYNSSCLLAAFERALFATPYKQRSIQVDAPFPAIVVAHGSGASFRAAMAPAAEPLWSRDDSWEGPILLPPRPGRGGLPWFRASIGGPTRAYRFDPSADTFVVMPAGDRLLGLLAGSQFTPEEWRIRAGATHARSRTFPSPLG